MIHRVRLKNYMSFGEPTQTAELRPITVLVGANNSGKTNFLRMVDFMRARGGGFFPYFHRPSRNRNLEIQWDGDVPEATDRAVVEGPGVATYRVIAVTTKDSKIKLQESIIENKEQVYTQIGLLNDPAERMFRNTLVDRANVNIQADLLPRTHPQLAGIANVEALMSPVFNARHVHPFVTDLKADNQLAANVSIGPQGSNLSALVAHWILEEPEKAAEFNATLAKCLPEMRGVHARCVQPGMVRLEFEQRDGERFDSTQVSDGVLIFAGLIAHSIEAPRGALVLMEEPERGIHPRRLVELVDILRTLVHERGVQFIMATHSPALINQFRDEPEAILAFSRSANGTMIRRISDLPELTETLTRTDPGELLASGFFNEPEPPPTTKPDDPT